MASSFSGSLRGGRSRKFKAEINVVPYIDVMLVLLVIFMVTAPMTDPSVINLPSAGKSAQPPSEYIQVSLKPDATAAVKISGGKASAQSITTASRPELVASLRDLHAANPDMPLMIAADKEIKYDEVIQVLSEAKKIGISRVGLATR
ncbi:ExbD/TolR family protein [Janthinobacterium sp. 17J80-10]|uniref:ExbD/TolR family protein n=1 Tax=Janthinobacterium sp. 17J80-10 TaxID=2497863 RepID=UPI0010058504|nr:ExbD/TolR family protein [Janthinobacterium sp. 17J80-10]QAU35260.1 ExbD/TolR family protein [Janthinobacterium sp. 17J80-10]